MVPPVEIRMCLMSLSMQWWTQSVLRNIALFGRAAARVAALAPVPWMAWEVRMHVMLVTLHISDHLLFLRVHASVFIVLRRYLTNFDLDLRLPRLLELVLLLLDVAFTSLLCSRWRLIQGAQLLSVLDAKFELLERVAFLLELPRASRGLDS